MPRSKASIVFILSGEESGLPEAEARALVRDLDPEAEFTRPERGLLVAQTTADPVRLGSRVAFSRRVGLLVRDGEFDEAHLALLRRGTYRVRVFGSGERSDEAMVASVAEKVGGKVDLDDPDAEVSVYIGEEGTPHLAIASPRSMRQGWSTRRPRSRAFFHPSAIFPKLSRALVNLSGAQPGEVFLDPYCGTGSLLIEASLLGVEAIGIDVARKMVRGAQRNSEKYGQRWLGVIRSDSRSMPVTQVGAIATDIPYGRASSSRGLTSGEILESLVEEARGSLAPGRKLVVMHPKTTEVRSGEMRVEQELDMYVHRMLTRTITVMRRRADG